MRRLFAVTAAVAVGFTGPTAHAQAAPDQNPARWAWKVPDGRWINIRNVNGRITVEKSAGDSVTVTATMRVRRGDPHYVRYDVQRYGADNQDVLVCALWGPDARCTPTGYDSQGPTRNRDNDIHVDFQVAVPAGVKVSAHTVNADVSVTGVTSEVRAGTINGGVDVETDGGPVSANSVNGTVHASLVHYHPTQDMRFTSVNGSVIVELADDVDANVELSTVNGRFTSDFPVTLNGRIDPRNLRAQLGKGGPRIVIRTVNGNVELRKH
jgi:phage baseplate assembly protein gpV